MKSLKVFKFKVRDYTTMLIGQRDNIKKCFYVQRGDGTRYDYDDYRVTFAEIIYSDEENSVNFVMSN